MPAWLTIAARAPWRFCRRSAAHSRKQRGYRSEGVDYVSQYWPGLNFSLVSDFREIVVFPQARNLGKLHNTVHCIDCTVQPGSGSAAYVARMIWSQQARAIGDNDADCPVSPTLSHPRNTG
jgi:hypothetical protein